MHYKYTKENEIDFYYFLIRRASVGLSVGENEEQNFLIDCNFATELINSCSKGLPREITPEVYEFYVSDYNLNCLRAGQQFCGYPSKGCLTPNKIKITICEDE